MKLTVVTIFAALIGTASIAAETAMIDGCAATKVEGANYFNFDDPRCVTNSAKFSSSKGEDARREREELLANN